MDAMESSILHPRNLGPHNFISMECLYNLRPEIWDLPAEVAILILKGLHVKDILNLKSSHSNFCDLIDSNAVIWMHASFADAWPSLANMRHFERAADAGNFAALVKLGVAYLYNEGLPGNFVGAQITNNGERAADYFCRVEAKFPAITPFTWLFIRPPWASGGTCCKECVFIHMRKYAEKKASAPVHVCVFHTLDLLEDEKFDAEAYAHLRKAARLNNPHALFLKWKEKYESLDDIDKSHALSAIRKLRSIALKGSSEAELELCHLYTSGRYGGLSMEHAAYFVRNFFQATECTGVQKVFQHAEDITNAMRYILVDWLVEVAGMKRFSSLSLHVAINIVDRFLLLRPTTRCKLQLIGVSAMVLCSRFLGRDVITIREAAWLTDNTYK